MMMFGIKIIETFAGASLLLVQIYWLLKPDAISRVVVDLKGGTNTGAGHPNHHEIFPLESPPPQVGSRGTE